MFDSQATTRGITVAVQVRYVPERSEPHHNVYFFAYQIRISNNNQEAVQLLTRHWVITDASGQVEEVRGPGVVGEQPLLEPGESFEYTSFCPLATPFGTMEGSYQMVTRSGETFDAEVARFALAQPMVVN
jgi:ApaG protein